jgi:hypothetical protein
VSSTVAALLVTLGDPELLPAIAELEPSPSFPPVELPKLQLDSNELGSAGFDVEAAAGLDVAGSPDDKGRSGEEAGRGCESCEDEDGPRIAGATSGAG